MIEHELLANRVFKNGGDMHPHTMQRPIGFSNQKGKPPKLLQQSGGAPRLRKTQTPSANSLTRRHSERKKNSMSEFHKGGSACRFSVNDSIK